MLAVLIKSSVSSPIAKRVNTSPAEGNILPSLPDEVDNQGDTLLVDVIYFRCPFQWISTSEIFSHDIPASEVETVMLTTKRTRYCDEPSDANLCEFKHTPWDKKLANKVYDMMIQADYSKDPHGDFYDVDLHSVYALQVSDSYVKQIVKLISTRISVILSHVNESTKNINHKSGRSRPNHDPSGCVVLTFSRSYFQPLQDP